VSRAGSIVSFLFLPRVRRHQVGELDDARGIDRVVAPDVRETGRPVLREIEQGDTDLARRSAWSVDVSVAMVRSRNVWRSTDGTMVARYARAAEAGGGAARAPLPIETTTSATSPRRTSSRMSPAP
jgi:hypothetical protein